MDMKTLLLPKAVSCTRYISTVTLHRSSNQSHVHCTEYRTDSMSSTPSIHPITGTCLLRIIGHRLSNQMHVCCTKLSDQFHVYCTDHPTDPMSTNRLSDQFHASTAKNIRLIAVDCVMHRIPEISTSKSMIIFKSSASTTQVI